MTGYISKKLSSKAIHMILDDVMERPLEELICTEGKVYGIRYHCVEPVGGCWMEMETWALSAFGDPSSIWDNLMPEAGCRWYMNNRKFWFRQEKDRTMFILKWS